jgi:hypothetical protein
MFQKKFVEKTKTHFMTNNFFFLKNRAVYAILWENRVESDRPQMKIWRTRFACWITKAIDTYSEYVILLLVHGNNGYANAPRCYVIRISTLLLLRD